MTASVSSFRYAHCPKVADQGPIGLSEAVIGLEIVEFNGAGLALTRQRVKATRSRRWRAAGIGQIDQVRVPLRSPRLAGGAGGTISKPFNRKIVIQRDKFACSAPVDRPQQRAIIEA